MSNDNKYGRMAEVNGELAALFDSVYDYLEFADQAVVYWKVFAGIIAPAFVVEVNAGEGFIVTRDEIAEDMGQKYLRVVSIDDCELPIYIRESAFEEELYQVFVQDAREGKKGLGYYTASSKMVFPTREAAHNYLKTNFDSALYVDSIFRKQISEEIKPEEEPEEKLPKLSLETIDTWKARDFDKLSREQLIALALYYDWEENVEIVCTREEEIENAA